MKLALLVKYDGTRFEGFQAQPSGNTVQQYLTDAVSRVFGEPCTVTGCSRTDSGVHALGYVAAAAPENMRENWCTIPPEKFHRAVRRFLPPEITVVGCASVDDSFHPRYSSLGKEYVYLMREKPDEDPFLRDRVWQLDRRVDADGIARMNACAARLVGRHDFAAFMASGSKITDTVREVKAAHAYVRDDGVIAFTVSADGFLYNMVRIMAGALVGAAAGRITPDIIDEALSSGRRDLLDVTAPPYGLYLNRVFYDPEIKFLCI